MLPIGTKVYIPGYGQGVVEDTGPAIQGYRLDIYMDSQDEAIQWGRKTMLVQIEK